MFRSMGATNIRIKFAAGAPVCCCAVVGDQGRDGAAKTGGEMTGGRTVGMVEDARGHTVGGARGGGSGGGFRIHTP